MNKIVFHGGNCSWYVCIVELKQNIPLPHTLLRTLRTGIAMLITFLPLLAFSQTMRPGDASNNGYCSHVDVLYVGLGFGAQGPIRQGASISWNQPQNFTLWNQSTVNGVNYGHIDCDGNGIIDSMDIAAIDQNFGLSASPATTNDSISNVGQPGAPPIALNTSTDTVLPC